MAVILCPRSSVVARRGLEACPLVLVLNGEDISRLRPHEVEGYKEAAIFAQACLDRGADYLAIQGCLTCQGITEVLPK